MLEEYGQKRDFTRTPEPLPQRRSDTGSLVFAVHKHSARRLHYDLRLEVDGILKSWAVPQGPSLDPGQKRLAVMVEDHPLDYASFEGIIPQGEYGAGEVIVWDNGTYSPEEKGKVFFHDRDQALERMRQGLAEGKVSIWLRGRKLKGSWTLVKMARRDKEWLLIKHQDVSADSHRDILKEDDSVISGLTTPDLKAGRLPDPVSSHSLALNPGDALGARRSPLPDSITPMLATLTGAPFSHPQWLFEPKLDGIRIITLISEGSVKLLSRRGLDATHQYPTLINDLAHQPMWQVALDGEVVALDEAGRPCFQCLQPRLNLRQVEDIQRAEVEIPVYYYVFDILYLNGYDLRSVPLYQRQELLNRVLLPTDRIRLVEHFAADGQTVYEAVIARGMEGIIAKHRDSVYQSGRRSPHWLKVKATMSDDFVIGGYTRGLGGRADSFGSLLLGYYDDKGRLVYAGHVGTGFDDAILVDLQHRLDAIKTDECPFAETPPPTAPTTWTRPELVAEVKFAQWTADGRLRAPSFLRLREDKAPAEVIRPQVAATPSGSEPPTDRSLPRGDVDSVLEQLAYRGKSLILEVTGHKLVLNNLNKELWPAASGHPALTKRDLLIYLAKVSPYMLPHLQQRPLTLNRYPDGIYGEHFYQKHWDNPIPEFVTTVPLSEHHEAKQPYILCNNLATLLWLGQLADLELHTWFSRLSLEPDSSYLKTAVTITEDELTKYPDFIIFDIDPYIYAGHEAPGAEPELNRKAFARTGEVARWLREILETLSLSAFIKTSGRTGLHIYVPIVRQFDYTAVRAAAETICRFLYQQHPEQITLEWAVEKRTNKVFLDYNQNARGKTLAAAYSPRPTPEATVSMPLRWDELDKVYPTDFTIVTAPSRLAEVGDLWSGILAAEHDLQALLERQQRLE